MGRDPAHPWVGESVPLDYAVAITGPPLVNQGGEMRYRVRDDGSSTMEAGQSFIAGFYYSEVMLSGDAVEASFVVVCSGVGTIRLSGGFDPDWSLDDPGDATVPMGTHTVSGDTVVVGSPFPSFDVDTYLSQVQETIVHVECLTGTVTVNQVKLRLWPPGGPVGAWVDADGFTVDIAPQTDRVALDDGVTSRTPDFTAGAPGAAFGDATTELVAHLGIDANRALDPTSINQPTIQASIAADLRVVRLGAPEVYTAFGVYGFAGSIVQQPDPHNTMRTNTPAHAGTYGLDYSWPPDEVPGDFGVQVLTPPTTAWGDMTVVPVIENPHAIGSEWASIILTPVPDESRAEPESLVFPYVDPTTPLPVPPDTDPLVMPDARTVLVSLTHPVFYEPQAYLGPGSFATGGEWGVGALTISMSADLADSTVTIPPHRYWSPLAAEVVVEPLRLRQRSDGLGLGSVRVRGVGSRQMSVRVRGYL